MINYLEGKLVVKDPTYVVVDINGIGYEAKISLITYSAIKNLDAGKIYTHLHIKEDAHTLYGFASKTICFHKTVSFNENNEFKK